MIAAQIPAKLFASSSALKCWSGIIWSW